MTYPDLILFDPDARQMLFCARKEAERLQCPYIGTEHLLLGLIGLDTECLAGKVLQGMGFNLNNIRVNLEKRIETDGSDRDLGLVRIKYTPRANQVFISACREARTSGHLMVSTGHILLGLLDCGGAAAAALKETGLTDINVLRQAILKELDPNHQPPETEAGETANKPNGIKLPTVKEWGDRFVEELRTVCDFGSLSEDAIMRGMKPESIFLFLELLIVAGYVFDGLTPDTAVKLTKTDTTIRRLDIICGAIRTTSDQTTFVGRLQDMYNEVDPDTKLEARIGRLLQRLTGVPPRKPPIDWLKALASPSTAKAGPPAETSSPSDVSLETAGS